MLLKRSIILLIVFFQLQAFAQEAEEKIPQTGPRQQMAAIIFAGLGGAVLGLSTLSFYGRPQDRLPNIGIGFALGIIAGTIIVTYKAATSPQEFYGADPVSQVSPNLYYDENPYAMTTLEAPTMTMSWTF